MQVVRLVLVLLLAVVIGAVCARLLPLLQIAIGAALSGAGFVVAFASPLFLLLFIPPLLFLNGTIFVLLGAQLAHMLSRLPEVPPPAAQAAPGSCWAMQW